MLRVYYLLVCLLPDCDQHFSANILFVCFSPETVHLCADVSYFIPF